MKNLFYALGLFGLVASFSSCSNDNSFATSAVEDEAVVTITASVPGNATSRAAEFSDGFKATDLTYAVYENGSTTALISETVAGQFTGSSLTSTLQLQLVTGKSYDIIFWAQSPDASCYSFDATTQCITVSYTGAKANDETRDAFFGQITKLDVNGSMNASVELHRPFAQINVGTNDITEVMTMYGASTMEADMTVTNVYSELNLLTGAVEDGTPSTKAVFGAAQIPDASTQAYPVAGYKYTTMAYVLVNPKVNADVDLNFYLDGSNTAFRSLPVPAAPLQRNYRTNIYGSLLTSDVLVNVEIKPEYETPDYDFPVWNGSATKPSFDPAGNATLTTPSEVAYIAKAVQEGNTFSGKTITLDTNVDLDGLEWTPIGTDAKPFNGVFDGNGHTIKNLVVSDENASGVGFFGRSNNGTIKNITIDGAKIKGYLNVGVVSGTPYTAKYENIKVTGLVQVEGFSYVGIFGKNAYNDISDVVIDVEPGSYVKAYSIEEPYAYRTYVGALVGFMGEGNHTIKNVTSNIDVYGSTCDVGGLVGIAHYGNNFVNCHVSGNVIITDADPAGTIHMEMGGLAGTWHNQSGEKVTFTDCSFTGQLKAFTTDGVDLSSDVQGNTLVGRKYSSSGTGELWVDGVKIF